MNPPTNNNKDIIIIHDEESNGREIVLRSGLAANHHSEEPEDADENKHSGNTNRCRTHSLAAIIVIVAAFAVSGVALLSSSKANISSNMQQAAVAVAALDDYINFGASFCEDANNKRYPSVFFDGVTTAEVCADKCQCARGIKGVNYRGFDFKVSAEDCFCRMDFLDSANPEDQKKIAKLNGKCASSSVSYLEGFEGSGEITFVSSVAGAVCYKLKGKASKAPKVSKAPKRG